MDEHAPARRVEIDPGTIRAVAVHEVVRAAFPRPDRAEQAVGRAAGKAIDEAVATFGHEHSLGRRPSLTAIVARAAAVFDEEVAAAGAEVSAADRERALAPVPHVVRAYRESVLLGLPRPRTRLFLIDGIVGVYAQPDFWDGRGWIYEMKSYRAVPPPPDVALQLRLFRLAFPGFREALVAFDRHADPVTTTVQEIPRPTPDQVAADLRLALRTALTIGAPKVLAYAGAPVAAYTITGAATTGLAPGSRTRGDAAAPGT